MARGSMHTLPAGSVGYDYSFSEPDHVQAWNLGYRFGMSYFADASVVSARGKILTLGRIARMADAGMGILPNFEQSTGDPLRGYAIGLRHGRIARDVAASLDVPDFVPIVFSCDVNVSRSNWPALDDYWAGVAETCGRTVPKMVPGYVESDYIDHLVELGYTGPMWWPAASSWSDGRITPNAYVKQLVGYVLEGTSDADVTLQPTEFWFPNDDIQPEGDDMTADQDAKLNAVFLMVTSLVAQPALIDVLRSEEVQAYFTGAAQTQAITASFVTTLRSPEVQGYFNAGPTAQVDVEAIATAVIRKLHDKTA